MPIRLPVYKLYGACDSQEKRCLAYVNKGVTPSLIHVSLSTEVNNGETIGSKIFLVLELYGEKTVEKS